MWLVQLALELGINEEVTSAYSYRIALSVLMDSYIVFSIWLIKNTNFHRPAISGDWGLSIE